jgi:hypothetical protein
LGTFKIEVQLQDTHPFCGTFPLTGIGKQTLLNHLIDPFPDSLSVEPCIIDEPHDAGITAVVFVGPVSQ